MNLDRLRLFYYSAKAQSFTHSDLQISASALSRQISTLEHEMKAQLFYRYPRKLVLTDKGKVLYEFVSRILVDLETMESRLTDMDAEPSGVLKVASPAGWASSLMLQFIPSYLERYPKIRLEMKSLDREPNFKEGRTDVAIFPYIPDVANLKHKHLKKFSLKLYASPAYCQKNGLPETVEDLDSHKLISYNPDFAPFKALDWHLSLGKSPGDPKREPYLVVNNLFQAVEQGLGIASLTVENPYRQSTNFINVLPEYEGPSMNIYCIYPEHLIFSKRVMSFINILEEQMDFIFSPAR